ncbi:MAG: ammonium transporter [Spirochaetales bacterium]|nr:ammonium transporter [Spirochaetales bacterium]
MIPFPVVFFAAYNSDIRICRSVIAEGTKFSTYLIMSYITSALIYPLFGHWAWGGPEDSEA